MIQIKWENGQYKTEKKAYIRYDYGQEIQIVGLEQDENLIFQFVKDGAQYNGTGVFNDGIYTVKVPDEVLAEAGLFGLYCFYEHELEGHTEKLVVIDVLDREMYPPREPEVYHDIIAQILERLDELQYEIDNFELTQEQLDYITQQVIAQIDLSNYYTKEEVNALIPDVSDFATHQDVTDEGERVFGAVLPIIQTKANSSDVYTKQQVDNLIPDMTNYYTKSEVYNKTEIDATLGNIQSLLEAI